MIRVEVTSEAEVTRMVAALQMLPALLDCDYEVWLVPHSLYARSMEAEAVRRAWRTDGMRGGGEYASEPSGSPVPSSQGGAYGHGGPNELTGGGWGANSIVRHNHGPADPCPDDCPSLYCNPTGGASWTERHNHMPSEPCGLMCPGNPSKPH